MIPPPRAHLAGLCLLAALSCVDVDGGNARDAGPSQCQPEPLVAGEPIAWVSGPCVPGCVCAVAAMERDDLVTGVWAAAVDDVWFAGHRYPGSDGFVLRWDGTAWARALMPSTVSLSAVWGSSASDVWLVGWSGTVLHWDGEQLIPVDVGLSLGASDLSGSAPTNLWAAGGEAAYRFDGTSWTDMAAEAGLSRLSRVFTNGPDDTWVGGTGALSHWDGSSWATFPLSDPAARVEALWGFGASDVWATTVKHTEDAGVLRWNGTSWTDVTPGGGAVAPADSGIFHEVWGATATDVWLFGSRTKWRWDGTEWSQYSGVPGGTFADADVFSAFGTGRNDVWAGAWRPTDPDGGVIYHWDGSSWRLAY